MLTSVSNSHFQKQSQRGRNDNISLDEFSILYDKNVIITFMLQLFNTNRETLTKNVNDKTIPSL